VSSRNRNRRQNNRDARAAAVEEAQRRAVRRRITIGIVGLALALVVGIALVVRATGDNGGASASSTSTSTTASSTTTTTLPSAKGKPCVAVKGKLPKNTPDVPLDVGPPPKKLIIRDLVRGTGPAVKPGATVKMDYVLVACSTGKVIESSFETGQPIDKAPIDQLIPGWSEGVPGMRKGGLRLLGVPPDLAYGSTGKPPDIAGDETLWFVLKLDKIEK
jgi:peptidylprolyl isomerase